VTFKVTDVRMNTDEVTLDSVVVRVIFCKLWMCSYF